MSGITSVQTGHPFDIFGNVDAEHQGLSSRADLVGDPSRPAGHPKTQTGPVLSAFDFPSPFVGLPGSVGRNRFYGPGLYNWDMVLSKDTTLTEKVKLELRFEAYNLFNRTQFSQPDNLIQDVNTFGFSSTTLTQPDGTTTARQLQFAAKLKF
jgi:hypothetical protein